MENNEKAIRLKDEKLQDVNAGNDHDLDIDYPAEMARIQNEMKQIMAAEKQSQKMLEEAFRGIGYGIE